MAVVLRKTIVCLPHDSGKWNSVFRRYRRWVTTGVCDAVQEILAEAVERDTTSDMIDSTATRAHHYIVVKKRISGNRAVWPIA
ncbi:MAG: hypothetical protein ABF572_11875 [Gluconobacter sp.]|uniref:hypothetical protein n=1 Tax=Gluconobacter sp. TaxID=1876758 RepID=UPI0039E9AB7B